MVNIFMVILQARAQIHGCFWLQRRMGNILSLVPLICLSVSMLMPCCLYYNDFVVCSDIFKENLLHWLSLCLFLHFSWVLFFHTQLNQFYSLTKTKWNNNNKTVHWDFNWKGIQLNIICITCDIPMHLGLSNQDHVSFLFFKVLFYVLP